MGLYSFKSFTLYTYQPGTFSTAIRKWNDDGVILSHQLHYYYEPYFYLLSVPTFDGHKSFKLSMFQSLPTIADELKTNSAVMVVFTLSSYTNTILMHHQDCDNINLNLSLNIQSVILLANADPTTDDLIAEEVDVGTSIFHLITSSICSGPLLFLSFALLTLSDVFHMWHDFLDKSTVLIHSLPYEFVPKPVPHSI